VAACSFAVSAATTAGSHSTVFTATQHEANEILKPCKDGRMRNYRRRASLSGVTRKESFMRTIAMITIVAATIWGGGVSLVMAGPHGCYSSHCAKN
jgi:hypothetical protein